MLIMVTIIEHLLKGAARTLDIGAVLSTYDLAADDQADFEAIKSDWDQVGRDLWGAIADKEVERCESRVCGSV
jgi:hypothetical protein